MSEEKILTKDEILRAQDQVIEKVPVPEWGGAVFVRSLTGTERDAFEMSMVEVGTNGKPKKMRLESFRAKLAVLAVCDEQGNRLFSENEVAELGKKNAQALDRVVSVAQQLSGLTARDVQDLTAGLKKDPSGDSTSG